MSSPPPPFFGILVPFFLRKKDAALGTCLLCSCLELTAQAEVLEEENRKFMRIFAFRLKITLVVYLRIETTGSAVGWDNAQRVRFPMVSEIFHWLVPSSRTIDLRSTQPLTEMSSRDLPWGVKVAGTWGWQTYHLNVQPAWKSWETPTPGALSGSFTITFWPKGSSSLLTIAARSVEKHTVIVYHRVSSWL